MSEDDRPALEARVFDPRAHVACDDLMAAADACAARPDSDATRGVATGGSYWILGPRTIVACCEAVIEHPDRHLVPAT